MTTLPPLDVAAVRRQFPALAREHAGRPVAFLDGAAGSQVPQRVADAVGHYLLSTNANHGGAFATARESDALLLQAHEAVAALLGTADPGEVIFGANMTTLTLALSRALARFWQPDDEIVVTRLDHDANVTPWVLAAKEAGATVRHVNVRAADCTLDLDDFRAALGPQTRLVAVGCASNAAGTVNPVRELCTLASEAGALVFLDAVHYAPHALIDVKAWGCDFLACSAYKFFGPHVGILYGRRELLEELPAYKVRPAPETVPDRWMTGTQNHEGIAGVRAAVHYLADLGRVADPAATGLRPALETAWRVIHDHEQALARRFLAGMAQLPEYRVWGVTDPERLGERVATFALTHARLPARALSERLAAQGIFTWAGNFYALALSEALGLEPEGMLRLGFLHYNTAEEVDRVLAALAEG